MFVYLRWTVSIELSAAILWLKSQMQISVTQLHIVCAVCMGLCPYTHV